jgi:chemotaxis protein MotB
MRKWKDEGEGEGHANSERWLLTYSDMITLLLALFIMLYSISNVDVAKFKALAENLNAFFNNGQSVTIDTDKSSGGKDYVISSSSSPTDVISSLPSNAPTASTADQNNGNIKMDETSQQILDKLNALILQNGIQATVSVHLEERGVVVRLEEGLLFPSGSAEINATANDSMNKIAQIILTTKNYIRVEGSTDNVPISTSQFPSNWELASQRAINVAKLMITDGVQSSRISVTSYGEFRPVAANDSEANKQQNRRVDIVFLNQNLNMSEAGGATPAPSAN